MVTVECDTTGITVIDCWRKIAVSLTPPLMVDRLVTEHCVPGH
jgi:hypothetical protein